VRFRRRPAGLQTYCRRWDERRFFENHIVPLIGPRPLNEVRIDEIRKVFGVDGAVVQKGLANKSVCNGYGLMVTMYKWAIHDDKERVDRENQGRPEADRVQRVIIDSPCMLTHEELPDKDILSPRSREPGAYTREEVVALLTDPRIPHDRHIFAALQLLTGMRFGEAAGLRWRVLNQTMRPLWAIDLRTQYDGRPLKGKGKKGGSPREIPVHPILAIMLAEWKGTGFAKHYGPPPKPDDYVCPNKRGTRAMQFRRASGALKAHTEDCITIGVTPRRDHDMRHTFISLARSDGARVDMLEKVTHNAKGEMIDHYTHADFLAKCQAVACLRIDLSGAGGPCWPPRISRSNHAFEDPQIQNSNENSYLLATPTGLEPVLPT
jgi:integrase